MHGLRPGQNYVPSATAGSIATSGLIASRAWPPHPRCSPCCVATGFPDGVQISPPSFLISHLSLDPMADDVLRFLVVDFCERVVCLTVFR